jgi:hypothetical protein
VEKEAFQTVFNIRRVGNTAKITLRKGAGGLWRVDRAMTPASVAEKVSGNFSRHASQQQKATGGIDLHRVDQALKLDAGQEKDIRLNVDPAMLSRVKNAQGLRPVIIHVWPLTDLPEFLGIKPSSSQNV